MPETDGAVTRLIERYLAIVTDDDYERFGELLTDDCTFTLMPIGHAAPSAMVYESGHRMTFAVQSRFVSLSPK